MTWSYSGDPSASDLDATRFYLGDTIGTDPQFSNEEINFLLSEYGSPLQAAVAGCDSLIAKYSRYADQRTGDISISYSKRVDQYKSLRDSLNQKMSESVAPYVGGISKADREIDDSDTDRVPPAFEVGIMDIDGRTSAGGGSGYDD